MLSCPGNFLIIIFLFFVLISVVAAVFRTCIVAHSNVSFCKPILNVLYYHNMYENLFFVLKNSHSIIFFIYFSNMKKQAFLYRIAISVLFNFYVDFFIYFYKNTTCIVRYWTNNHSAIIFIS